MLSYFMGCIDLVQCVLVLRCGLAVVVCGTRMQVEALVVLQPAYGYHTPPQPYHNVTPTHIEPDQYNPRNNSTHKSQAPEDGCINIRNMLSIK